jgi:hypothetical protein
MMVTISILTLLFIICVAFTFVSFAQQYSKKQASIIADDARSQAIDDVLFKVAQLKNPQNLIEH